MKHLNNSYNNILKKCQRTVSTSQRYMDKNKSTYNYIMLSQHICPNYNVSSHGMQNEMISYSISSKHETSNQTGAQNTQNAQIQKETYRTFLKQRNIIKLSNVNLKNMDIICDNDSYDTLQQ